MQLLKALRLDATPRLALTGAGGKTTALFQLARQLLENTDQQRVLVTASTHLAREQLSLADHHIIIQTAADLLTLEANLPEGLLLITGPAAEPKRTAGLNASNLARLHRLAETLIVPY